MDLQEIKKLLTIQVTWDTSERHRKIVCHKMKRTIEIIEELSNKIGILFIITFVFFLLALYFNHSSPIPWAYTWFEPLRILHDVIQRSYFPTFALSLFAIGRLGFYRKSSTYNELFSKAKKRLQSPAEIHIYSPYIYKSLVCSFLLLILSSFVNTYNTLDYISIVIIGVIIATKLQNFQSMLRPLYEITAVAIMFTGVSYGFTLFKSMLFLGKNFQDSRDLDIIAFETAIFGVTPHQIISQYTANYSFLIIFFDEIYYRLFDHMILVSIFLIGMKLNKERIEFLSALAFCYIIGGISYHLCPALGPFLFDHETYRFLKELPLITNHVQSTLLNHTLAASRLELTELKSYEFLACMPSLHMAHEFVMLYYARHSMIFFCMSLIFTFLTFIAIISLGFHYPIDAIFGGLLSIVAIMIARWQRDRLLPYPITSDKSSTQ